MLAKIIISAKMFLKNYLDPYYLEYLITHEDTSFELQLSQIFLSSAFLEMRNNNKPIPFQNIFKCQRSHNMMTQITCIFTFICCQKQNHLSCSCMPCNKLKILFCVRICISTN